MAKRTLAEIRQAADSLDAKEESELVFDWCFESATQIMQVMNFRHQKTFVRKIKDFMLEQTNLRAGITTTKHLSETEQK